MRLPLLALTCHLRFCHAVFFCPNVFFPPEVFFPHDVFFLAKESFFLRPKMLSFTSPPPTLSLFLLLLYEVFNFVVIRRRARKTRQQAITSYTSIFKVKRKEKKNK
jgi:hypothetical protein